MLKFAFSFQNDTVTAKSDTSRSCARRSHKVTVQSYRNKEHSKSLGAGIFLQQLLTLLLRHGPGASARRQSRRGPTNIPDCDAPLSSRGVFAVVEEHRLGAWHSAQVMLCHVMGVPGPSTPYQLLAALLPTLQLPAHTYIARPCPCHALFCRRRLCRPVCGLIVVLRGVV